MRAKDLSSGEKVLCQLVLWLFTAGKDGVFPKLLLLDEPDAHLHPSLTLQFIDVIKETLVGRYGVRVIMTTHSPSTVALAPENSIFEIERGAPAIKPIANKADIISVLTAGLVTVSKATKFCFVEDEDDVAFYEVLREILMNYGPSRDPHALRPSPSIVFISASVGRGASKVAGGCTVIDKWIDKLSDDALSSTFLGLRDRDVAAAASARVFVTGRYSIENYLLDPLNIFAALVAAGTQPRVEGVSLSPGDEHLLREQSPELLQRIAETVCRAMQDADGMLNGAPRVDVRYTRDFLIGVPAWVVDRRGHDLLPIAQTAFGERTITPPNLRRALQRARLLPLDLAELFASIQTR